MREKGLIEYKSIGMAKVWHTATKYDLVNMISKYETSYINQLVTGFDTKIRDKLGDNIPLSLFRVMKVAMGLSNDPKKAMYNAGQFVAKSCFPNPEMSNPENICSTLSKVFERLKIGILEPVQINPAVWNFKLDESASAHETLIRGNSLCYFEAGLIAGYVTKNLDRDVIVRETKCIGTGSSYCEFTLQFVKIKKKR